MKRISYDRIVVFAALAIVMALSASAVDVQAVPINSAVLNLRIFDDCFTSNLTTSNNYPAEIWIDDDWNCASGWANFHNWSFSKDGVNPHDFANADEFTFSAIMTITGPDDAEAGLRISPWWSLNTDGRFQVRTTDGEIACFGGRLPFFSFTGTFGLNYVKGNPIWLEMVYSPNGLSLGDPATIVYNCIYEETPYTSGPLAFDEGNPAEGHGSWGMLEPAQAGGWMQAHIGGPGGHAKVTWAEIVFTGQLTTATENDSWGGVKSLFR